MSSTDRTRAWLALLAALAILGATHARASDAALSSSSTPVAADGGSVLIRGIRTQDEIVLVDMRGVGSCCDPDVLASGVRVSIYAAADESGCRRWMQSDLPSALTGAPGMSTVIFVHGNRLSAWDAKSEGLAAYRRLACRSANDTPIRFVIFSWPSAQIRGPLKDVRVKAARTGPAGCQLAWVIDQLPADTQLTLVGFSFGARIVTGALHILGGGHIGYCSLAEHQHPDRRPANVVLLAAAVHADWLCPGHCHGLAMSQVDEMLLVNNCDDPAMKYYHFVSTNGRPQALGCCGPTCIDAAGASKIVQRNVSCYVGNDHDVFCYLSVPGLIGQIWDYADSTTAVMASL